MDFLLLVLGKLSSHHEAPNSAALNSGASVTSQRKSLNFPPFAVRKSEMFSELSLLNSDAFSSFGSSGDRGFCPVVATVQISLSPMA